jgi:hypothetical protein
MVFNRHSTLQIATNSFFPVCSSVSITEPIEARNGDEDDEQSQFVKSIATVLSSQRVALKSALSNAPPSVPAVAVVDTDQFKRAFYLSRFPKKAEDEIDQKLIESLCVNYIEGLVWVFNYYYQGHLSWSWYYRFYTAPFVSGEKKKEEEGEENKERIPIYFFFYKHHHIRYLSYGYEIAHWHQLYNGKTIQSTGTIISSATARECLIITKGLSLLFVHLLCASLKLSTAVIISYMY